MHSFFDKNAEEQNQIDCFQDVTILFADIAGFTKYSSSVSPMQVVDMLRGLFTEFDKLCKNHELYKVYTIGDCYVVLGFLDANNRSPDVETLNVLMMSFSMLDVIKEVREKIDFHELDMRIGIHRVKIIKISFSNFIIIFSNVKKFFKFITYIFKKIIYNFCNYLKRVKSLEG